MKQGIGVRWYPKEAILTDRALYLYKAFLDGTTKSDYQHDAHQRISLADLKAKKPSQDRQEILLQSLPSQFTGFDFYVELSNDLTQKCKLLACQSEDLQQQFLQTFNLVANFNIFDDIVSKIKLLEDQKIKFEDQNPNLLSYRKSHARIEQWVQQYRFDKQISLLQDKESIKSITTIFTTMKQYFRENFTYINISQNHLNDTAFAERILPDLKDFSNLKILKITNNQVGSDILDNLVPVFEHIIHLEELDLSQNLIGNKTNEKEDESKLMDFFLFKFFTTLKKPLKLNFAFNQLKDDCLRPLIKYTFANRGCALTQFNLQGNRFSPMGQRTLLKGHAMCKFRDKINFIFGGVSLTLENMRALQVQPDDQLDSQGADMPVSITIQRKSNNFHGNYYVKSLPTTKAQKKGLSQLRHEIKNIVTRNRDSIYIEQLRDFIARTTKESSFEIPRHELEIIFNLIYEKLELAINCQNIYYLEVLIDCLRLLNARNIPAEQAYFDLFSEAQQIAIQLERIMNMEWFDDREMQKELFKKLKRAKQIGLRGELIDSARHFYLLGEKTFKEMMDKKDLMEEDEDAIYDVAEEDRPFNVFDVRLDKYIDMDGQMLGLTTTVEEHLAKHPYSTDYLLISNLNLNYVRKNLSESKRFLKDEESYAFRNIFERSQVLLSDAGEVSEESVTYNLARNDMNLRLARLIFRYKNNLDHLFMAQEQSPQITDNYRKQMRNRKFSKANQQAIEIMRMHPQLREGALQETFELLLQPLTNIDADQVQYALAFSKRLKALIEIDPYHNRQNYIYQIQAFFEDFVVPYKTEEKDQEINNSTDTKISHELNYEQYKLKIIVTKQLRNEYFLQIFRLIHLQLENIGTGQSHMKLQTLLVISVFLSQYTAPSSYHLQTGFYHFFLQIHEIFESQGPQILQQIERTLNNIRRVMIRQDNAQYSMMSQSVISEDSIASTDSFIQTPEEIVNWAPTILEIESLLTGIPIKIAIELTDGTVITEKVDLSSSMQSLVDKISADQPYFNKENETETFWIFRKVSQHEKSTNSIGPDTIQFDYPLPADERVLGLIYKAEKQGLQSIGLQEEYKNQRIRFIMRKRLFPMMYLLKNFHLAHKHTMDLIFDQTRLDYVEYHLLKDACATEDIVYFAALLLKVKLQSLILTSRKFRVNHDQIKKHLSFAVPSALIAQEGSKSDPNAKTDQQWANLIIDWLKKKEFLEQSVEEAQSRFLKGMASYQISFSSYYLLKRDSKHKSRTKKQQPLKKVKMKDDSSNSSDADSFSDEDARYKALDQRRNKKSRQLSMPPGVSIIQEASHEEEEEPSALRRNQSDISSQASGADAKNQRAESSFWAKFETDQIMLVLSIHGIILMDANNREQIVAKVMYEDLLYVMGKGQCLKIGFLIHQMEQEQSENESMLSESEGYEFNCGDCRTEIYCAQSLGMDARVIAEDIISYAQLKLLEMTKNNLISLQSVHHHHSDHHDSNFHSNPQQDHQKQREIDEMMDDDDLGQESSGFIQGLGNYQENTKKDANQISNKKLTPAEQYKKQIQEQLGQNFSLRQENIFCYRRKYPLFLKYKHREEVFDKLVESIESMKQEIEVKETIIDPVIPKISINSVQDKLKAYNLIQKKDISSSSSNSPKNKQQVSPPPIASKTPTKPPSVPNLQLNKKASSPAPKPPAPVNLNNFMSQFAQMQGSASTQSFGAGIKNTESQSSLQSVSPGPKIQIKDEKASAYTSSQSSKAVDFIGIQNKDERKSNVDKVLSSVLDDAPF